MDRGELNVARIPEESPGMNGDGMVTGEKKAGEVPVLPVNTPAPYAVFMPRNWLSADTGGRKAMIRSVAIMTGRPNFRTRMMSLSSFLPVGVLS